MTVLRLAPMILLAACALPTMQSETPPVDRIAAECALLSRATAAMGAAAHDGLLEGCPGVAARDTRPLSQQTASLRAANAAPLPASITPGTRADTVFRRMITRGVPPALATTLATSEEFTAATQ